MKTPDRILELLYDRGEVYFGLEELARAADVKRQTVSRAIDELRSRGHRLAVSPADGVRLEQPVKMEACLVEHGLRVRRVGRNVICFDEVGSTNDVAWDSARQRDADGLVVLAESQRAGRGRFGRSWISPPGANVLMSVLLTEVGGLPEQEALTIAAGLAAAEGVERVSGLHAELKWPNDVLFDGRKLAGVLVEARRAAYGQAAVVGVGINVNAAPPAPAVDNQAVCLAEAAGHLVDRIQVVRAVLERLDEWLDRLRGQDGAETLHQAWTSRCGMLHQRVTVHNRGVAYVGRVLDVTPRDGLVLLRDDGTQVRLSAAGSTLR